MLKAMGLAEKTKEASVDGKEMRSTAWALGAFFCVKRALLC